MHRSKRYSQEVRERAVRLLFEHAKAYRLRWAAMVSMYAVSAHGTDIVVV